MAAKRKPKKLKPLDKILCLEGEWSGDIRREESVRPLLHILRQRGEIQYIYRQCGTKAEFEFYLRKRKYYRDYRIVYLSFHGARGKLRISPEEDVTLSEIAEWAQGAFKNKLVYFGSCKTLKAVDAKLQDFLQKTGAAAVAGYDKDVGWVESSAFELLFLYWAAYYKKPAYLLRKLASRYPRLGKLMGFKYHTRRSIKGK
ncbi:MAG: hypothetical protein PVH29_14455 [Candidatus Zixiibacteriota bacterium]|jgi:hypothetical protein